MNKIKQLQVRKLLKELDYVESDYNYKNEIIHEADNTFIKSVNEFLQKHPTLKEIFDKKMDKKIENAFNKKLEQIESVIQESDNEEDETINEDCSELVIVDPKLVKIKKLYHEIVKATHPDRIQNKKLNEIYLRATFFYNKGDIAGTYSVCDELDIYYEADEDDYQMIVEKINKFKERINFLETTMTFKWYISENGNEKNQIILDYIKAQLQ